MLVAVVAVLLLLSTLGWATTVNTIEERLYRHIDEALDDGLTPLDFHHLFFAFLWQEDLSDWKALEPSLDRLASARSIDPLMADELRHVRSRLAVAEGRPAAALELFRSMGGMSSWWVSGPMPIDELEDFNRVAVQPDPKAEWRPAKGCTPLGWIRLDGVAWPARRQMVFLATTVASDRAQEAALRVGAAQVARLWINGELVLTSPQPLDHAEDQMASGVWLRAGANLIVAAVASENEDWWFRLRITEPDGSPITGVSELDAPPQPVAAQGREAPSVRTIESEIRHDIERGRRNAALALAAYLVHRRPYPVGSGEARAACREARAEDPAEARVLEWLVSSEPSVERQLLEEALAADPELVTARIELASWYARRGLAERAHELLDRVTDPAARAAALDLDAEQWGSLVLPELVTVADTAQSNVEVQLVVARRALDWQRWELARKALSRLEALVPGLETTRMVKEKLAVACGDVDAVKAVLEQRLEVDPNWNAARIRLARLAAAEGGVDRARELLLAGLSRCPDNPDMLLELAQVEHGDGNDSQAAAHVRQLLERRPQEQRAQRMLRLLGDTEEDSSWLRSPEELWALADQVAGVTPAAALLEHVGVRFLPANLTSQRVQRAFLVTDADRCEALRRHSLAYVPEHHQIRVLAARILRRDGSEISARQHDTPRLAEPEINIFYDTRLRILTFPELEDGDLIDIAYVLTEASESNETGPYVGGLVRYGGQYPLSVAELVLSGAEERLPTWELVRLEGEPERRDEPSGEIRLEWQWHDIPAIPREVPPAPELTVVPHVVYSNYPRWGDLADWYARHIAPRVRGSRQVDETASRLCAGLSTRLERIAALYRFVTDEIRYVGLEFGEHRFRPFSADWILHHRIGDCKDKAALLVALLRSAGIPARMVMVRISESGPMVARTALLECFNHAIVYLPEDDLWLDGTASGHDPFPPPGMDQGAWVLVVDGQSSKPQTTPAPGGGVASYDYQLSCAEDGQVAIELKTEETGEAATIRRSRFGGSLDQRRFAGWLQQQFPGAELVGSPETALQPGAPAKITLKGRVSRAALLGGGGIPTFPGDLTWVSQLVPQVPRHGPFVVPVRPLLEWSVRVVCGHPTRSLPKDERLSTAFGSLELDYELLPDGYELRGRFRVTPGLVAADDAGGVRSFLVDAGRLLKRPLEVP